MALKPPDGLIEKTSFLNEKLEGIVRRQGENTGLRALTDDTKRASMADMCPTELEKDLLLLVRHSLRRSGQLSGTKSSRCSISRTRWRSTRRRALQTKSTMEGGMKHRPPDAPKARTRPKEKEKARAPRSDLERAGNSEERGIGVSHDNQEAFLTSSTGVPRSVTGQHRVARIRGTGSGQTSRTC